MNKIFLFSFFPAAVALIFFIALRSGADKKVITFYEVPLVCGAAPEIGCGSRVKPLFIETEKISSIKESWLNRQGTVISLVWDESTLNEAEREKLIQPLFEKHSIEARLIKDEKQYDELLASFNGRDKWYKGMDVDQLSIEESGIIAESFVEKAESKNILNEEESARLKKQIEDYFKKELVKVRTYDNLMSSETQDKWLSDLYNITAEQIGKEKADKIVDLYYEQYKNEDCCKGNKNDKTCCSAK